MAYYASKDEKLFVLQVQEDAKLDDKLKSFMSKYNYQIKRGNINSYSVYVGAINSKSEEIDGWVIGEGGTMDNLISGFKSDWLKETFKLIGTYSGESLLKLKSELETENINQSNIDEENIKDALMVLLNETIKTKGLLLIQ